MKQSKVWFEKASELCGDIGPGDGIDPRLVARATGRKPRNYKGRQLGKEARHSLSMIFAGELGDPVFQDLEIVDVSPTDDGQFLIVSLALVGNCMETSESEILEKCRAVNGYLRSAIAWSVKRKRVPMLKFELLR